MAALPAGAHSLLRPWLEPPPPPPESVAAPSTAPGGPRYPIESGERALPKLTESDPAIREAFAGLVDANALAKFFNLDDAVRRIVATIDNLPRETVAMRLNPVRPTAGTFVTSGKDEALAIAPRNAARYEPFLRVLEGVDMAKAVGVYVHFYPLFEQAYVELGYPLGHFNDRLVEVIDHLVETPEVEEPVKLVAPHVLYEYADPDLESLSAGRKVLVRMGNANAARGKAKRRELCAQLIATSARSPGSRSWT